MKYTYTYTYASYTYTYTIDIYKLEREGYKWLRISFVWILDSNV